MAGKTYATKGYSTYTGIPTRPGGYDHGPKTPVNQYAIETKTIERVHTPAAWSTDFVGSPSKIELLKEYVHSPTMWNSPNPNYGPNYENSGPPMTHHHLTTSTNNINEALGFLESVKHSPRSNPRQRGVLDELSARAQPLEPQKRYARPSFVAKPNDVYKKRIDSYEGM